MKRIPQVVGDDQEMNKDLFLHDAGIISESPKDQRMHKFSRNILNIYNTARIIGLT